MFRGSLTTLIEHLSCRREVRLICLFCSDVVIGFFALALSIGLRLGEFSTVIFERALSGALFFGSFWILIASAHRYYESSFRYFSLFDAFLICRIALIHLIISILGFGFLLATDVPRTVGAIAPIIHALLMVGFRQLLAFLYSGAPDEEIKRLPIIVGALSTDLPEFLSKVKNSLVDGKQLEVVASVTLDQKHLGKLISGVPVIALTERALQSIRDTKHCSTIALSPHAKFNADQRASVIKSGFRARKLEVSFSHKRGTFKDFELTDVIGRAEHLEPLPENVRWSGETVLVSGAGGSIGSELVHQLLLGSTSRVILVERSELALHELLLGLKSKQYDADRYVSILGDCCDRIRMRAIMNRYKPAIIFHTAAYKHVYLVENNFVEGFRNNVLSTLVLTDLCIEFCTPRFVLISSDKAVRPSNVMGATKRLCELIVAQQFSEQEKSSGIAVRFGNVFGSSGSVMKIFSDQLRSGKPLTVTDKEATRYFMTISEAVRLVLCSAVIADSGDVMLLDMGEPISIYNLAQNMVEVEKVRNPEVRDIPIVLTGLSPGEKLHEEMWISSDAQETTYPKIFRERLLPGTNTSDPGSMMVKIREVEQNSCSSTARDLLFNYVEDFTLNLLASDVQASMVLDDSNGDSLDRINDIV